MVTGVVIVIVYRLFAHWAKSTRYVHRLFPNLARGRHDGGINSSPEMVVDVYLRTARI